jgi:hypothetical protein
MLAWKAEARCGQPLLHAKLFTTLGAAGVDDIAAAVGFHSGTKTVSADALDFAGLISSFHGSSALKFGKINFVTTKRPPILCEAWQLCQRRSSAQSLLPDKFKRNPAILLPDQQYPSP